MSPRYSQHVSRTSNLYPATSSCVRQHVAYPDTSCSSGTHVALSWCTRGFRGNYIYFEIRNFQSLRGRKPTSLNQSEIWQGEADRICLLLSAKFHVDRCNLSPLGKKTENNRPITGRAALRGHGPDGKI